MLTAARVDRQSDDANARTTPVLPMVSVVIPTHRRPQLLRRCLLALLEQEYPLERLEIVVVEDGEPTGAEQVVNELAARSGSIDLHYLRVPPGGPAATRNAGWRRARGELVAFTDDDTIPHPRWIAEAVRAFAEGADAVSGRTIVPVAPRPTDAARNTQGLERAEFATCNAFVRWERLEAVGGFDARFERAYREDSDLQFSLLETGARIVQRDTAIVVHPPREEPRFVSIKQQRNQFFDALLYRKHPRRFRAHVRRAPPWTYYAITAAQFASLASLGLGRRRAAAAAAAIWLSLVGKLFARRLRGTGRQPADVLEMAITSVAIPPVAVYWRLRGAWKFRVFFL